VTSAADSEVNVIFGSVINESLKEEIVVTVIATGFQEIEGQQQPKQRPVINHNQTAASKPNESLQPNRNQQYTQPNEQPAPQVQQEEDDTLDIPTFLRNRNRNR